jgi:hypothetical protein
MPRLPDRFDLWVRKARETADPARQVDYVLGAMAGLVDWHFLNAGTGEAPRPAVTEMEGMAYLVVFSDLERIEELIRERGGYRAGQSLPVMSIPASAAMGWCLELGAGGVAGLVVNPGEDGVVVPMEQLAAYHAEWKERGGRLKAGFWIPNLTSEEEDFWQENGL